MYKPTNAVKIINGPNFSVFDRHVVLNVVVVLFEADVHFHSLIVVQFLGIENALQNNRQTHTQSAISVGRNSLVRLFK